jgi:hypothetical protein
MNATIILTAYPGKKSLSINENFDAVVSSLVIQTLEQTGLHLIDITKTDVKSGIPYIHQNEYLNLILDLNVTENRYKIDLTFVENKINFEVRKNIVESMKILCEMSETPLIIVNDKKYLQLTIEYHIQQ